MILLMEAMIASLSSFAVSNSTDPCCGYLRINGTENAAGPGNASRASWGSTSQNRLSSTSMFANFAALLNAVGGCQLLHVGDGQSGNCSAAVLFAAATASEIAWVRCFHSATNPSHCAAYSDSSLVILLSRL